MGGNLNASIHPVSGPSSANQTSDWISQTEDEIQALIDQPMSSPNRPFIFKNSPHENGPFLWPNDDDLLLPNHGLYSLTNDQPNHPFLSIIFRLIEIHHLAIQFNNRSPGAADTVLELIHRSLGQMTRLKEVEWAQQRGISGDDAPFVNTEIHYQLFGPSNPTRRVSAILSLVMENVFFASRRSLRALLGGSRSLIRASGGSDASIKSVPKDPRAGSYQSRLDPTTRQFVVCISCHKLYPFQPGDSPNNEDKPFITHCNNRRTSESAECNTALWKERVLGDGRPHQVPIRKYLHQDLKSWVGRLLSRKGMENIINTHVDPLSSGHVHDIWSSEVFKNLKGPSGDKFFPGPANEGRLIFSLSVDSFNPFHMKTAKQTVSSTGIWMVLLNLPQHLRYLHENMYVAGIIPGPDKPSKEDIYPYLELVMDDLLEFWYTGVRFSRTEENLFGRLYRAMLIPLICDMLAARQVIGFASATSHNFCTFCDLDIDDIDVLDRTEWPTKNQEHIRHIASLWRDAATPQEQAVIFDSFGIRWSPLHLLPYWDFIQYTVIDPMHALDLNLLQNHIRTIFQIDTKYPGGDGRSSHPATTRSNNPRHLTREQQGSLDKCIELIRSNADDMALSLVVHPRSILYKICIDNNILGEGHNIVVGIKWILANNIVIWRRGPNYPGSVIINVAALTQPEENEPGGSTLTQPLASTSENGIEVTTVVRIIRHLLDRSDPETSRTRAYTQGTAAVFAHICGLIQVNCEDVDRSKRNAKHVLYEKVINKIDESPEIHDELDSYVLEASRVPGDRSRPVLGIDVMEAIWADMRQTLLPSWVTPAPPNWGTTQRGKLSADNWRVICTIHLPITLIRMWEGDTERKRDVLLHFMDLVNAVRIANMCITSPNQINAYNHYITRYMGRIKELFPDQNLKPTHHAALHIGDMLGLFGPNHSHSGPHYERYINFFHRINTNSKIGQLENTLLRTSARSANIRSILADNDNLRSSVMELVNVLENINREDARGFCLASLVDPLSPALTPRSKPVPIVLPASHKTLLCDLLGWRIDLHSMPDAATSLKEIIINGVCYTTQTSTTSKDSQVIFQDGLVSPSNSQIIAGIIAHILQYSYPNEEGVTVRGLFLLAHVLLPIEEDLDPYRSYPFGGFLAKPPGQERIFRISQVKSHFALTRQIRNQFDGLFHVLPVDRLMLDGFEIESLSSPDTGE